jgi:hypothetical protein
MPMVGLAVAGSIMCAFLIPGRSSSPEELAEERAVRRGTRGTVLSPWHAPVLSRPCYLGRALSLCCVCAGPPPPLSPPPAPQGHQLPQVLAPLARSALGQLGGPKG